MLTGSDLKANNLKFRAAADEANAWFTAQLRAKGLECSIMSGKVCTNKADGKHNVTAIVHIYPNSGSFGTEYKGIVVRVQRRKHPIVYSRETIDWKSFPWKSIIARHLTELDDSLAYDKQLVAEHDKTRELGVLARQEVPMPLTKFRNDSIYSPSVNMNRRRKENGTYSVDLRGTAFTAEEVIQIRDIAITAHNRSEPQPIVIVPSNEKTLEEITD